MFPLFGQGTKLCDGIRRREFLRVGGLSALGLSLPTLLQARQTSPDKKAADPTFGRAKNVIYVWLQGGPPQHETFDPKPHAPSEIRGPFQPIQTNIPGIQLCELLPRTARIAHKLAIVRSLATDNNIHSGSGYEVLTGYKYRGPNPRVISPTDWPYFGSIVKMLKPSTALPALSTVWIPQIMRLNENVTPAGQTAGFLGPQWDPDRFTGDPSQPDYEVKGLNLSDVPPLRLKQRRSLLEQVEGHFRSLERGPAVNSYNQFQSQAFDLLTTGRVRNAFAIQKEPGPIRDRYGRTQWGQCLLLARRLIEAGVRLVHVNWIREPGDSAVDNPMWDTHAQNPDRLEDALCPKFDVGFTALIEDLDQRGLLDETLVVAIGEFGRTPKINDRAGRDHWGPVFSFALAGAGIQTGQVHGASDKHGAYPAKDRVTPADLTATLFHLLGLSHEATFHDPEGRELHVTTGQPIRPLLGSGTATAERVPPGGAISRVPPYNDALLLNTDFTAPLPLRPVDFGSRPKGWRAGPLIDDDHGGQLGVTLIRPGESSPSKDTYIAIGFNLDNGLASSRPSTIKIPQGAQALLGQEMRNPRLGTFSFSIRACGHAPSKDLYDDVFRANFTCRLIIYRYLENTKNPTIRQEFISLPFDPPFAETDAPTFQTFQVSKRLDSDVPGQNFPIGKGFGVAVLVEKTTPGVLELPAGKTPQSAFLRIQDVQLDFNSRTINDKVKV